MRSIPRIARHHGSAGWSVTLAGLLACTVCALIAGCGGGDNSGNATAAGTQAAVDGSTAAAGAGGASDPVAIVALPASGPCAASGTPALQAPGLNSQIDCAP
jgi:hypothetical protein